MISEVQTTGHLADAVQVISTSQLWTGRILSGLAVLFFVMDGVMKLFKPPVVVKATVEVLGFPASSLQFIGLALLLFTGLYVFPRTAVLGAILLTGFLGGAIASQVRIGASLFNIIFPAIFAAIAWAGLWLRDLRVRSLIW